MTLGWLGNILILFALWQIGQKKTSGWIFSITGNIIWCIYAYQLDMWDMAFIDVVTLVLATYNWWKWSTDAKT